MPVLHKCAQIGMNFGSIEQKKNKGLNTGNFKFFHKCLNKCFSLNILGYI